MVSEGKTKTGNRDPSDLEKGTNKIGNKGPREVEKGTKEGAIIAEKLGTNGGNARSR